METRQERKERIAEHRKRQILEAALTVFSRKGFGEATIPEIAREADIAVGTIYNYYEGKRDLLVSLLTNYIVTEPLVKLLQHPLEADDRAFLTSLIEDRLNSGLDNMDRFFFLLSEVQRDPELRQQYAEEALRPLLELIERYLESRIASGAFRLPNATVTARALGGMIIGFLILCRIEGEGGPCQKMPRQELAAKLADLVLGGLQGSRNRI